MIDGLYRLSKGVRQYRNPLSYSYHRWRKTPIITVVDRKTGLRFKCRYGAHNMMGETFHTRIYDVPVAPIRSGDLVVDIGANHGFYACLAALQGATVHAFEPDPFTFDFLVENIRANGFEKNVRVYPMAVGAETGETEMFCTTALGGGMSSILPDFAAKTGTEVASKVKIKVLSFSDAMRDCKIDRVRICKLDCEGAELGILASLDQAMRERVDVFTLEYHPPAYSVSQLLEILLSWDGYHISKVSDPEHPNSNLEVVRSDVIRAWAAKQNAAV